MQSKIKELLVAVAVKNNGNYNGIVKTIHDREPISSEEIAKYSHLCQSTVTPLDEDCPKTLTYLPMPPLVLFLKDGYRGLLADASKRGVCVLDDRRTPKINEIVGDILDHGGTIVVPNFENGEIMLENKQHFLIITEYPDECYDEDSEVHRSRVAHVAAGLCGNLFVGYGIPVSDVKIAVDQALDIGSDICVAPTSIDVDPKKSINNQLIQDGADVAFGWKSILDRKYDKVSHKHAEK